LSDKLEKFALEQGLEKSNFADELTESNGVLVNHIKRNLGYFISYEHLFSTWLAQGSDFNIAHVRTAMSAFSRNIADNYTTVFDGIFKTLESGLSKLGDGATNQTNAVKDLFVLIADIPMDGKQGYDVLGFIYEYLISMFAANAGKKAGEFYTPHEVSLLMSEIIADHLKDREEISIYDPTSGSGSLLINIGHSVAKHLKSADSIKYYAQELKENTYNLTRMNLVMRGILPSNIFTRNADTLEDDWPLEGEPLYLDAVVSNPPYSQPWNPKDKEGDIRYKRFGVAPQAKADFAFLLHDLFHLKPDGIMTIVLPHGVLFRGGEEEKIRKNLIEYNHIDAIIGLPANIFFGTGIPTIIIVLRQERERNDVLMIDASKHFIKVGKNNHLQASDIKRIVDCVTHRRELPKFSRIVPKAEIVANGYNLNIPRYVDSAEPTEQWDIFATIHGGIPKAELAQFADYWAAFDGLQTALFTDNGTPYVQPKTDNLKAAMQSHAGVLNYQAKFAEAKKELEAQGVTFPIHLDLPVDQVNKTLLPKINSLKQSVESTLGAENVVVDVVQISTEDYANATFQAPTTADHDYDLNLDGWSADYQDPSTYLNPFNSEDGFYLKILGLDPSKDTGKITSLGLDQFTQRLKTADAENTDVAKRYENYADAQAWLIDSSLLIPVVSNGGGASVTRVIPFTRAYSLVGIKGTGSNYKYMRLQTDIVTSSQFAEAKAKWEQERKNSVEKSQKDFESHVK